MGHLRLVLSGREYRSDGILHRCQRLDYLLFLPIPHRNHASLGFGAMISSPSVNVLFLLITLVVAFFILSFNLQGGLERVTKYMMSALLVLCSRWQYIACFWAVPAKG